jgi:hypothetical protein
VEEFLEDVRDRRAVTFGEFRAGEELGERELEGLVGRVADGGQVGAEALQPVDGVDVVQAAFERIDDVGGEVIAQLELARSRPA